MKQILVGVMLMLSLMPFVAHAQSNSAIKIIKPGDRRNVELGNVNVIVEVTGVNLQDGYAWQILIDGVPQGIVRDALTTTISVPKPTGPHHLTAQLLSPQGNVISSHDILVIAAPVESRAPIFNRAWFGPLMFGFTIVVCGIIFLGLRLRPRTTT